MRWILSFLHITQAYLMMVIMGIVFLPWALVSKRGAWAACHAWARWTMWTARILLGIKVEVRGTPPTDEVLIAAKHQSFLDIIMIYSVIPWGKFIMKHELLYTPIIGVYSWRLGCVPVKRGRRTDAIRKMLADVQRGAANPGQLCIYPQGTRVMPRDQKPYKVGTYVLYRELGQICVPVATNAGVFWPRKGILKAPGTAVVEFLPPIPQGYGQDDFMAELENRIETASDKLLDEAGA